MYPSLPPPRGRDSTRPQPETKGGEREHARVGMPAEQGARVDALAGRPPEVVERAIQLRAMDGERALQVEPRRAVVGGAHHSFAAGPRPSRRRPAQSRIPASRKFTPPIAAMPASGGSH